MKTSKKYLKSVRLKALQVQYQTILSSGYWPEKLVELRKKFNEISRENTI